MYGGGVCVRSLVPWRRLVHLDEGRAAAVRLPGGPVVPRTATMSVAFSTLYTPPCSRSHAVRSPHVI